MPMTVRRPHLKYREIRPEAIEAAKDLFEAKPWRADGDAAKIEVALPFVTRICEAYRVATPEIQADPRIWSRYSYRAGRRFALTALNETGTITLRRFTVIDLFTSLRWHINESTGSRLDTFAWACSLFYAAKPVMFRARVREGRIPGVVAKATYTQETWDQLVSEGKADDITGRLVVEEVPSEETMEAIAEYVDELISDAAAEGIDEIEAMLREATEDEIATVIEEENTEEEIEAVLSGTNDVPMFEVVAQGEAVETEDGDVEVTMTPVSETEDEDGDPVDVDDLDSMNRDALRAEAARLDIAGRGRMLAPQLREAIRQARRG